MSGSSSAGKTGRGSAALVAVPAPAPPPADAAPESTPKPSPKSATGSSAKPVPEPASTSASRRPLPDTPPDPGNAQKPPSAPVRPPVRRAYLHLRHWLTLASFLVLVLAPTGGTVWYLWERAADQYASYTGFSVRREEGAASAAGLLGGLAQLAGSGPSPDADILYQLLQSQQFVAGIDEALDLRAMWSLPGLSRETGDPVFAFDPGGSLEDLVDYWRRMVRVSYDAGSGLIEVRALAFRPGDANAITGAIIERSSVVINDLNAIAREDAIRYSRDELDVAVERLKEAREALTRFRNRNQLVDPAIDLQAQSGLIGTLQAQLAEALIEADLLRGAASSGFDPRLAQIERRIEVIEARIADERTRLGLGGNEAANGAPGSEAFADLVGEYERLQVEQEFARQSYVAAMAAHDAARAEARRQSRYLAAHILPTTAETARFPQRTVIAGLVALFAFLAWSILVLVVWSLRDRR